jgi:hypothetical protein
VLKSLILILALASSPLLLGASPPNTPKTLVETGVVAYMRGDATAAVAAWVKGGPMEGNPQAMTQANTLRQVEDFYGKPVGFDVLKQADISDKSATVYFTVNYQKGNAFARLNAYKKPDGAWVATSFFFHTEAAQILPSSLLGVD